MHIVQLYNTVCIQFVRYCQQHREGLDAEESSWVCAKMEGTEKSLFKGYPILSDTQKINILNMTQAIQNLCCPRDLNFDPVEMGTPLGGAVLLKLRGYMAWPIIMGNPLPSLNPRVHHGCTLILEPNMAIEHHLYIIGK